MKEEKIICISCPIGCHLTVTIDGDKVTEVKGNKCIRGQKYAEKECTHPERTVTTTVRLKDGTLAMLPVKTSTTIPKELIFTCAEALKDVVAEAPVKVGDIIVKNILGTGADIVATRTIDKK